MENSSNTDNLSYSQLLSEIKDENIKSITITSDTGIISGEFYGININGKIRFRGQINNNLLENLIEKLENTKRKPQKIEFVTSSPAMGIFLSYLPIILLMVVFLIIFRRASGGGGSNVLNFSKSRAKLFSPDKDKKVTFSDVAGVDEAKEELQEIVDFLKEPKKFQRLGGRIPKGVLLVGSPGTGKTLLARAVAGEAGVPFFSLSGSDFVEMFVGVGAARVRDLFEKGKKNAPCILFIDEIDAVGRHRGAGLGGGHDEREQTLNALLVEMDGFESSGGVILIAATNRSDVLDPALLRPGRFDRRVVVDRPDLKGRADILKIHTKKIPLDLDPNVDIFEIIARGTSGFTGADLANLTNEAALNASKHNRPTVTLADLEFAKDKVLMGGERRSLYISPEEKEITAYHEAGHAIMAVLMPSADPLHKITIIPRGMSMGSTMQLPEEDKHNYSKEYFISHLAILMGGRCAEEIKFGKDYITSGASSDIERATDIAYSMTCEWGMSELGPRNYGKPGKQPFVGRQMTEEGRNYSEKTTQDIDREIDRLITNAYKTALETLHSRLNALETVSKKLLEEETINGDDVKQILNQKEP